MKLTGVITENVIVTTGVSIIADAGTVLRAATANSAVLAVSAATVLVSDLKLVGARGTNATGNGLTLSGQGASATLRRLKVDDCDYVGVNSGPGTSLVIEDSIISNNRGGGVDDGQNLTMRNTMVVHNGQGTGYVHIGGMRIEPTGTFRIESSTIASNRNSGQVPTASGIECYSSPVVVGRNNILTDNALSSGCVFDYSLFSIGVPTSAHNRAGDPQFKSTDQTNIDAPNYFRIGALSAARDAGDNGGAPSADIDGDPRPIGGTIDMGADEFKP